MIFLYTTLSSLYSILLLQRFRKDTKVPENLNKVQEKITAVISLDFYIEQVYETLFDNFEIFVNSGLRGQIYSCFKVTTVIFFIDFLTKLDV